MSGSDLDVEEFLADGDAKTLDEYVSEALRATGLTREQALEQAASLGYSSPGMAPAHPDMAVRLRGRRLMEGAGVPEEHIRSVCDGVPVECDALREVRRLMADPGQRFLVLSGGVGTQKTGSACWALSQAPGEFVEAPDLLDIKFDEKPRMMRLRAARLVVLDDLGTEGVDDKGHWIRVFNRLMNAWYGNCAKVVITCNLTPDQFRAPWEQGGYGERVADRVRHRGRWVRIGGKSVRGPADETARNST